MARGIPSSPKRNRGGQHPKSKKVVVEEDEDADAGQTRCICNQQHHEGVMIQCETCKVWQHCPCVGLGNGEVTPDKYYCDSCRPENHPYRVQDGQLISPKAPPVPAVPTGSKGKSSKKRSTMNSKDAAFSTRLLSPEHDKHDHSWDFAGNEDVTNSNGHLRISKRRKKMTSTEDDHAISIMATATTITTTTYNLHGQGTEPGSNHRTATAEKDCEADSSPNSTSPKITTVKSKSTRPAKSKKATGKTSDSSSSPESPTHNNDESNHAHEDHDTPTTRRTSGKKASRATEDEKPMAAPKRRKVTKSETPQQEEASLVEDHEEEPHQTLESSSDTTGAPSSSADGHGYPHGSEDLLSVPLSASKKAGSRKSHPHTAGSDTPTPSSTPQPMQPAPPAKVKYPSSRMSIKDMSKRAQQLLDYISRVQVEMAELKAKSTYDASPAPSVTATTTTTITAQMRSHCLTVDTAMQAVKAGSTDAEARWLSTPPQSVHELSHGEGSEQATATFKQSAEDVQGQCHHVIGHPSGADTRGSSSGKGKVPMTPPHQAAMGHDSDVKAIGVEHAAEKTCALVMGPGHGMGTGTSVDLIDKLTGELIRFQERFGRYVD